MPTKMDYVLMGLGAVGAYALVYYVPSMMKTMSTQALDVDNEKAPLYEAERHRRYGSMQQMQQPCSKCQSSLSAISGIDLDALKICQQKGLM